MGRSKTVHHVSPEENIDQILSDGIEQTGVPGQPMTKMDADDPRSQQLPDDGHYGRLKEGVYVCIQKGTMEKYAAVCLGDTLSQMDDDERLAMFRATVDADDLRVDPECQIDDASPRSHIHDGPIPADDVELVEVGVLD